VAAPRRAQRGLRPIESSFLENQIKADIPGGIEVELSNRPDWNSASPALVAEYDLKVPGWAAAAGQRALLPVGLFGAQEKRTFQHTARIHPLYFSFPHQSADDVAIELPANWQVSSVPKPRNDQSQQSHLLGLDRRQERITTAEPQSHGEHDTGEHQVL